MKLTSLESIFSIEQSKFSFKVQEMAAPKKYFSIPTWKTLKISS
jgi:hypothetical protein